MSNNFDDIFEPAPQAEDFDKEAWAAKKKAERDEVYALADATAEEVCADGGKFREYLDVQANFRHYSATNALLILAAKPDARRLGDKDFWRDQGVYIKRQEFGHPIKIVESNGEYTRDDGSIGVSYTEATLYDRAFVLPESVEDAVLRNMRYEALHNAINKLPETQRRRLILYYFNGLTYSQIAEMEGCKYQTVQDSIYAALNNLKKILK